MKEIIQIIIMVATTAFLIWFVAQPAESREQPLTGTTTIYHETGSIIYNEVGMSATVEPSDCRICLKRFTLDDCKLINLCLDVSSNN